MTAYCLFVNLEVFDAETLTECAARTWPTVQAHRGEHVVIGQDDSAYELPTPRCWDGLEMTKIYADELQPGDVVEYDGRLHSVSHVDRQAGWSWPIAADDTGWAIALDHNLLIVLRRAP